MEILSPTRIYIISKNKYLDRYVDNGFIYVPFSSILRVHTTYKRFSFDKVESYKTGNLSFVKTRDGGIIKPEVQYYSHYDHSYYLYKVLLDKKGNDLVKKHCKEKFIDTASDTIFIGIHDETLESIKMTRFFNKEYYQNEYKETLKIIEQLEKDINNLNNQFELITKELSDKKETEIKNS